MIDYFSIPFVFIPFATPEVAEFLKTLNDAAAATLRGVVEVDKLVAREKTAGFPQAFMSGAQPPFDYIGDFLRGRKGVMLDMYRCPDKLIAAAEKLVPMAIEKGIAGGRMSGNPGVFIALHGCVEGFMSVEQFRPSTGPASGHFCGGSRRRGLTRSSCARGTTLRGCT